MVIMLLSLRELCVSGCLRRLQSNNFRHWGKYIRSEREDSLCVVFTFVRGDGNKHYYAKSKLMFVVVENTHFSSLLNFTFTKKQAEISDLVL